MSRIIFPEDFASQQTLQTKVSNQMKKSKQVLLLVTLLV
jgi:hypothetical protein